MSTPSGKKKDNIWQIGQLKHMLKKWRNMSLSPSSTTGVGGRGLPSRPTCSMSPMKYRRCYSSDAEDDGDDICSDAGHDDSRIRAGSFPIYVGSERRRFVIPTRYLNLPVFDALLKQAEEEFGYQNDGGLVLPCDVGFFAALLRALRKNEKAFASLAFEDALRLVAEAEQCRSK